MPVIPPGDTVDRRPEVLPPELLPLFDDRFVDAWDRYVEFVSARTCRLAAELELGQAAGRDPVTAAGLATACGYADRTVPILDWILRRLAQAGQAEADGPHHFRLTTKSTAEPDPAALHEAALAADPAVAPAYELAETAAAATPAVLRGETSGEEVLLGPDQLAVWQRYFANSNRLYAVNNEVAAMACEQWAPAGELRILELGGGLGSAADALLGRLDASGRLSDVVEYRFTELALPFLRRGQRSLQARWGDRVPFGWARLDMNRPLADQGVEPGTVGLAWAVNTLHVARDLEATLAELCTALQPDGVVVIGECVRPFAGQPLEPELIFNLLESFRSVEGEQEWRSQGGFLTPEQWLEGCRRAGLEVVSMLPDLRVVRRHYDNFVVAALVARRR